MNAKLTILVLAAVSLNAITVPATASAEPPWLLGGYSCLYGAWHARGAAWEDLPYFALYPPVYYGGLSSRSYGGTPVWYGGHAWGPQPPAPPPMVVVNQFTWQKAAGELPPYGGPPGPKLIKNPYYVPPDPAGRTGR
jgi:hypothetical protein